MKKVKAANLVWTLKSGGIEAAVINMYQHMNRDKVMMDFIIDTDSSNLYDDVLEKLGAEKIEIFSSEEFKIKRCYKLRKAVRLYKIFKNHHYDVIYNNISYPSTLMYGIAAKMAGVSKVVSHAHSTAPAAMGKIHKSLNIMQRRIFSKYSDSNIAASKEAGIWGFGNRKFTVVPNGIDFDKFQFSSINRNLVRRQLAIWDDEILLGNIGRLTPQKNQLFILDVFASLREHISKTKLVIAGTGEMEKELKARAAELGAAEDVIFYGYTRNIESLLSAVDIFLFPSLWEGFGIAAIEAQASGLVSLISDAVPDNVLISENAWRLPLKKDEWVQKISDLINDGRYKDRIKAIINQSYDIKNVAYIIENIITGI